jgi:multisubunit Na+/H+ antiporter MnhG subunit
MVNIGPKSVVTVKPTMETKIPPVVYFFLIGLALLVLAFVIPDFLAIRILFFIIGFILVGSILYRLIAEALYGSGGGEGF